MQQTAINQAADWQAQLLKEDGSQFSIIFDHQVQGQVEWQLTGLHNVYNAVAAIAAARHIGILPSAAIAALGQFKNVKRRMEVIAQLKGVTIYDDFAHHPTAIKMTLEGLRKHVGSEKIIAVLDRVQTPCAWVCTVKRLLNHWHRQIGCLFISPKIWTGI